MIKYSLGQRDSLFLIYDSLDPKELFTTEIKGNRIITAMRLSNLLVGNHGVLVSSQNELRLGDS